MTTFGAPPVDQASRLRAMMAPRAPAIPARPRHSRVIAIASGKGGVGKTNLAVNLSVALARAGLRTALVDADLGMANADVLCGVTPGRRLEKLIGVEESPGSYYAPPVPGTPVSEIALSAPGGFTLIPGSVGVARMADLSAADRGRLLGALRTLESAHDAIIIDTAAGLGPGVLSFCRSADMTIAVATPEPTSIADAYALIKCLWRDRAEPSLRIGLVVNQAAGEHEGRAVGERIAAVAKRFLGIELRLLGWIPQDPAVPLAVRKRSPFLIDNPSSPAALAVTALVARLVRTPTPMAVTPTSPAPASVASGLLERTDDSRVKPWWARLAGWVPGSRGDRA